MGIDALKPVIDDFAPLYHVRPDAPPILLLTGNRELELLGRYEENAYLNRGNAKFKTNDFLGSIKDYEKSLEINEKSYIALNNIGVSKFKLKKYKSALEDFKKSLKINPRNYSTLYNKSLTHLKLKEIKKACIDLKKSIKLGKEVFKGEYLKICL